MGDSNRGVEIQIGQVLPNEETPSVYPPSLIEMGQGNLNQETTPTVDPRFLIQMGLPFADGKKDLPTEKKKPEDTKETKEDKKPTFAETFRSGLDDVIQVNTIFGSAVFIGLSFSYMTTTLETREECKPGDGIAEWLVIFEITAFGFFILSTLLGKALKVHLYITKKESTFVQTTCRVRLIMCGISTLLGSIFLYLSMINVLQMRLGKLTCRGHVWIAAGTLTFLYILALVSWVPSLVYASVHAWDKEF